ncbi:hypothetical protein D3C78_1691970 [compost metagenome]
MKAGIRQTLAQLTANRLRLRQRAWHHIAMDKRRWDVVIAVKAGNLLDQVN